MKAIQTIYLLMGFAAATSFANAQSYPDEYLGLPGDNLNLYAVMNLFQESETLEGFERKLNDQEQVINNLDLNGDGLIDYLTVADYPEGNVHTIVLRAALGRNEQQDVAVFVVEELRNGAVQIQLIGDEALYGPNYIVEPIYAETPNPGYTGKVYRSNANYVTTTYYDIAAWPLIRFMFHPAYVVWRSSWYWGYYPSYWRPWRAHYWHYYYGYHYHWHNHYYSHYRHWNRYRCRHYHNHYYSHVRVHSPTVVVNINKGRYRSTYSRPDQRRAGEDYYTRTASRRNPSSRTVASNSRNSSRTVAATNRQTVQRSTNQVSRSNARMSTSGSSAKRSTANVQRSGSTSRSTANVQRSGSTSRSTANVQRSGSTKRSAATVQRSTGTRSKSSSVQRSSSQRSTPTVQRSTGSRSKSSTVRSSQPGRSKSSTVQPSRSKRSTPTVKRSSSTRSKGSSVQRSQSSKSRSTAQRSSSRNTSQRGSKSSRR